MRSTEWHLLISEINGETAYVGRLRLPFFFCTAVFFLQRRPNLEGTVEELPRMTQVNVTISLYVYGSPRCFFL